MTAVKPRHDRRRLPGAAAGAVVVAVLGLLLTGCVKKQGGSDTDECESKLPEGTPKECCVPGEVPDLCCEAAGVPVPPRGECEDDDDCPAGEVCGPCYGEAPGVSCEYDPDPGAATWWYFPSEADCWGLCFPEDEVPTGTPTGPGSESGQSGETATDTASTTS